MKFTRFEDIIAWQKAEDLTIEIYSLFKDSNDFAFKDQIQRAAISVMNNIAEGYERKTNKEFTYFLYVAKGSCGEVRSMLHIARKLQKIQEQKYLLLVNNTLEISKILSGLIKSL